MWNLSLRSKILLPILATVLVAGGAAGITTSMMVQKLMDDQMERAQNTFRKSIDEEQSAIINSYHQLKAAVEDKVLEEAALFSRLPVVERAYRVALSGNIDDEADPRGQEAREMLRREMAPYMDGFVNWTVKKEFQLHYHLPNAHSLVRLWRDGWQTTRDGKKVDLSDDISGFRESVLKVNESGKP